MSTLSSTIVQRVWNYCNPYGCGMTAFPTAIMLNSSPI